MPNVFGLLLWALGDTVALVIYIHFFAVLLYAVKSWLAPAQHNTLVYLINLLVNLC